MQIRNMVWFVVTAAMTFGAVAGEFVLAERGKPAECTIIRSETASASVKYAAEELRDFLAKTTGVTLPIETDAKKPPSRAIVVGETRFSRMPPELRERLGDDGFRLVISEGRLLIQGSDRRGALYGVYEVLERYAGCRWYASWHSVIPARDRVTVPDALDDVQVPAFAMRQPFWYDYNVHRDFAARLRVNGYNHCRAAPEKYGVDSFRFGGGLGSCHTFNALMPPDEFFAEHPEYFSFENGKRVNGHTQLCLTNPDVLRIVTERVLARIRKDPGAKFYGVSQNDWYHYCRCEKCRAVDDEEESHAGTVIRFVNAVAEAVEKVFPDVVIETLAYQYTRRPPKKTRLRHNVVPCLCTIECDFARPIDVSGFKENVAFRRDIEGWKRQTDQLYVWDYTTAFRNYTLPFANVLALQGNLKFFRENNVKEIFEQGAYQGRHGDFAELKGWLLAKWSWNPDLPAEPLMKDFFEGYYGKGAPFVRRYFDELHDLQMAYSTSTNQPLSIWVGPENPALADAFLEKAAGLWDQAIAATKDDKAINYNVRMGAFSVDFARLERLRRRNDKILWLSQHAADIQVFRLQKRLAKGLLNRMDEAKDIRLSESGERHNGLIKAWRALVARDLPDSDSGEGRGEIQEAFLPCSKLGTWGDYVDDPKASDGKALKLYNTHHEWCCQLPLHRIGFEPGAKYTVRVRARCERASDGEAFWAGVYDFAAKKDRGGICPRTDKVGTDYAWYDVCTFVPNDNEVLWIAPGRFDKTGRSAIQALWIDKIEFVDLNRPLGRPDYDAPRPPDVEFDALGRPSDAFILFDGKNLDAWRSMDGGRARWPIQPDGTMLVDKTGNLPNKVVASIYTRDVYTNFQLHVEFRIPEACAKESSQWRGNSGVKIFGCYEVQILDSYHRPSYANGLCGALYCNYPPAVVASAPLGRWQSYDIVFHAPRIGANGVVEEQATFTVLQNGVLVQDHVHTPPYPNNSATRAKTFGDIELQSHNDASAPISFRNVWIRRLP